MTNEEKYKTPEERVKAFEKWCLDNQGKPSCDNCIGERDMRFSKTECFAHWLALEAEEEMIDPCPFCGGETRRNSGHIIDNRVHYWVDCINPECIYRSAHYTNAALAVAEHNRVCRAVKAAKESEVAE